MTANDSISVSVIALTYKQPEVLELLIQGLNAQGYGGPIEVIVTDDGSPETIARRNIGAVNRSKHDAKYVWQPDRGYRAAAARNNGIRAAQNDLLIFLDGDMVPCEDFVERHVANHCQQKRLVAGNRIWLGEYQQGRELYDPTTIKPDPAVVIREKKERQLRHEILGSQHPWRACFSANISVRRSSLVYFDERFVGWGPEDVEFGYRLCEKCGFIPVYDETISAYHLESAEGVGNVFRNGSHDAIVSYIRNTFLLYDECPGLSLDEVFFGCPRLRLDPSQDSWSVVSRGEVSDWNLESAVRNARNWIIRNAV